MNFLEFKNNEKININNIPIMEINELRNVVIDIKLRPVAFLGKQEDENVRLYVVLADDKNGLLHISSSIFPQNVKTYESFTQEIPSFHMFEREFYEDFDIKPLNHPWLKPVRNHKKDYTFFEMDGEEVHQVGVGPIHAGIIEPGHFRFMCNGEMVYSLEIQLGYQKRGVEQLILGQKVNNQLAESICGDTVIGHNLAYSKLIEALTDTKITNKAEIIRLISLEMERIAIHIGDMAAISGDIAYLMGNSVYGATRTLVINTLLEITGSRFGRGLIKVGGVNFDINEELANKILTTLEKVTKTVIKMTQTMISCPTVRSRLEKTGVLSDESAKELNIVGMSARASGIDIDTRFDFSDKWFEKIENNKKFKATNDVYSRFILRYKEILESTSIIKVLLENLKQYKNEALLIEKVNDFCANTLVVSITEGWRGEIIHIGITDENSNLSRYKIKDASFNNWYGLAIAVRNEGISDFPLCNKSFNLSYCGNDL